jgi:cobalt-zinc-cadmium efflux system outer membrane protein
MLKVSRNTALRLPRCLCAFVIPALAMCGGCARYKAAPLDPAAVQQRLQQLSLNDVPAEYAAAGLSEKVPDFSAGLGPDEVGLAALIFNPALKVKRLEKGIAAAQLVTAGLYPNPSLDTKSLLGSMHPTGNKSLEASLSFEVLRWQERSAEKAAKKANVEAVHYEILAEEWKTVSEARTAYWNVVAAGERLRLSEEERKISEKLLEGIKGRIRNGAGTALDLNLAELQYVKLHAEGEKLEADAAISQRALRQAIGLPYDAEFKLRIPGNPLSRSERAWKLPQLVASLTDSAVLKAVEWRYCVSENDLRAAIARQYPGMRLGPSGTFDFDGHIWSSLLGFVATIDVPLLNQNQGEVKEKQAARDVARAEYVSRLHATQAAVANAALQLETIEKRLLSEETSLLPKAQESIRLTQKSYTAGDISGYELLTAQSLQIEVKRSYLEMLIEYRQGLEALEMALGRRLEDVLGGGQKP